MNNFSTFWPTSVQSEDLFQCTHLYPLHIYSISFNLLWPWLFINVMKNVWYSKTLLTYA